MNRKENIAPLTSIIRKKENFTENLKMDKTTKGIGKSVNTSQQKQLVLKDNRKTHEDKKENNQKEQKTNQSKSDFLQANKIPLRSTSQILTSTPTHTDKPNVYNDSTIINKKPQSRNDEGPMLLRANKDRIHVHHKPLKTLQTPVVDVEQKEIEKLKMELKEKEQEKEEKTKQVNQLKELLKVYKERQEQQKMLEEAEDMITSIYDDFDETFNTFLMSYSLRLALKEQQYELLLNELSEINYRLSEQEEEEESD